MTKTRNDAAMRAAEAIALLADKNAGIGRQAAEAIIRQYTWPDVAVELARHIRAAECSVAGYYFSLAAEYLKAVGEEEE